MLQNYGAITQALMGTLFTWGLTAAGASMVVIFNGTQVRIVICHICTLCTFSWLISHVIVGNRTFNVQTICGKMDLRGPENWSSEFPHGQLNDDMLGENNIISFLHLKTLQKFILNLEPNSACKSIQHVYP